MLSSPHHPHRLSYHRVIITNSSVNSAHSVTACSAQPFSPDTMETSPPAAEEIVYRLLTRDEWTAAVQLGHYPPTDLDRSSGFIHLSTLSQSLDTANLFFSSTPSLLLMQLPTSSLSPHLVWDWVPARSSHLPHYHQPHIGLSLITQLTELPRTSPSSSFTLPPFLPSLPPLYKIASAQSLPAPAYHGNAKDASDGFIHLATAAQLPWVARKFQRETDELCLLTLQLGGGQVEGWRILWETAPSLRGKEAEVGFVNLFAHFYGVEKGIPSSAVMQVQPLQRMTDGTPALPSLPPLAAIETIQ